ncbi:MAG: sigma-54 interaction domain-containing protein, partial [Candidatus Sumerlaeota bacterium]
AMESVFDIMERVIDNDVPVLIMGESGTGKELVADAIHSRGPRKDNPIIKVNCAAIPEQLLESELFGHEKGSFTGATESRAGRFEQAQGGTLFLDEIGDMPVSLQAKILRAIQEGEVQRVGGKAPVPVDVRLLTATNRNLAEEVAARRFREDLYFRINVIAIELPPLRQRLTDIPLLVDHFIKVHNARLGKSVEGVGKEVMDLFLDYPWPGNIREMENVIQRALIMATEKKVRPKDLPLNISPEGKGYEHAALNAPHVDFSRTMPQEVEKAVEETEKAMIHHALQKCHGRQETADLLGISRKSLHNKMLKYNIKG